MKRLLSLISLSLLIFFSCQKENIDEVFVEDLSFEPDTTVEKSGFIRVKIDEEVVFEEAGYAFSCNATHRDEVSYLISNDFTSSLAFFNHSSNQDVQISSSFRWTVSNNDEDGFILPFGHINYLKDDFGYFSSPPVQDGISQDTIKILKESILEFTITKQSADFIQGHFKGTLKKVSLKEEPIEDEGRLVDVSGEFNLPLYKNCEIGLPIGGSTIDEISSILYLPYDLPQFIGVKHIKCIKGERQRNLISTVPSDFTQFDEAPQSLLQNEHDYYIYWEYSLTDTSLMVQELECKININLPTFRGIAELSNYQDTQFSFDKDLNLEFSPKFIRSIGVLKTSENEKILGVGSITVSNSEGKRLDCQ